MLDFRIERDSHGCLIIGGHLIVRPEEVAEFVALINEATSHEPERTGADNGA